MRAAHPAVLRAGSGGSLPALTWQGGSAREPRPGAPSLLPLPARWRPARSRP